MGFGNAIPDYMFVKVANHFTVLQSKQPLVGIIRSPQFSDRFLNISWAMDGGISSHGCVTLRRYPRNMGPSVLFQFHLRKSEGGWRKAGRRQFFQRVVVEGWRKSVLQDGGKRLLVGGWIWMEETIPFWNYCLLRDLRFALPNAFV